MAKRESLRRIRYGILIEDKFTPLEARELSILPRNTPALKAMRSDRVERWERFAKIAKRKLASGSWKTGDIQGKWTKNLSRMYSKHKLRVQFGPTGKQPVMAKGMPNVWALYRYYVKYTPDKQYKSPWELTRTIGPPPTLNRGVLFGQKLQMMQKAGHTVSSGQIRNWMTQLDTSIRRTKGERRQQLIRQRDNLSKLL